MDSEPMKKNLQDWLPDIRQTLVLNAPIQKVWNAVATSEGLAAWFMPNNLRPVVGHEFSIEAGPYGKSSCKVTDVDSPNRLSFRWGKDWTLTFELKDLHGKTELTLVHSGWTVDEVTEFGEGHAQVRETMSKGWVKLQEALSAYVDG